MRLQRGGGRLLLALPVLCLLLALSAHVSLAATIDVDQSTCILQNAITSANSDTATGGCTAGSGDDIINLASVQFQIRLTATLPQITSTITLEGANQSVTTDEITRIFRVSSAGSLTINDLTMSGSRVTNGDGGAILNEGGTVTINNSTIKDYLANNGGAIKSSGTLTISNTAIKDTVTGYAQVTTKGGALYITGGSVTITNSAISGSIAEQGGAIYLEAGSLTISNSTIANSNRANNIGGAGGINVNGGTATISHTTIYGNTIGTSAAATALVVDGSSATVNLRNSILGDGESANKDCALRNSATLAQNIGNVIENGEGVCVTAADRNTPDLGPFTDEPGYHMPNANSEANGAGDDAICKLYPTDQNGVSRWATGCDAGSVERGGYNEIIVNANTNNSPDTVCTFTEAITSANGNSASTGCTSGVADALAYDLITLTLDVELTAAPPSITSAIIVDGAGHTLKRASASTAFFRPFKIDTNGDLSARNITVQDFTTGTASPSGGAAIYNTNGKLTLTDCVFKNNFDNGGDGGGAIFVRHGHNHDVVIDRCSFIGNRSLDDDGGAIKIMGGDVKITNTTFINNTCGDDGCGFYRFTGTAQIYHSTFWDNKSTSSAGSDKANSIYGGRSTSPLEVQNTIIGLSTANGKPHCGGAFKDPAIERGILVWNDKTGDTGCGNADKIIAEDPLLGGQTGFPPHLPLGAGSPARGKGIDRAIRNACSTNPIDQRGASRPQDPCDIGAVEYYAQPGRGPRGGLIPPGDQDGGDWVRNADGVWVWVPHVAEQVCTGEWLNENTGIRVNATYDICDGIQFQRHSIDAIGIQWIIDSGPLDVVDVWGWVRPTAEVCFPQAGKTIFLDASTSPRSVQPLDSFRDGDYTCARITRAGMIVLMSPASPYGTPPAASPPGPLVPPQTAGPAQPPPEPTAIPSTALTGCMVRTKAILNLRSSPGGAIVGLVPWEAWLTALEHSPGWFKIDFHGAQGWISADYVEPRGDCE